MALRPTSPTAASSNPSSEKVTFGIREASGDKIMFTVSKKKKLKKVFQKYAALARVKRTYLKFYLEGYPVHDDDTAKRLGLRNGCIIFVNPNEEDMIINFSVVCSKTETETCFKVLKRTKMKEVFEAYAARVGVKRKDLRFYLHGRTVRDNNTTVGMLGLQNGSTLYVKDRSNKVVFCIRGQTGSKFRYAFKKETRMGLAFDVFARRKGVRRASLVFVLDGEIITDDKTVKMAGLKNRDTIDVLED